MRYPFTPVHRLAVPAVLIAVGLAAGAEHVDAAEPDPVAGTVAAEIDVAAGAQPVA